MKITTTHLVLETRRYAGETSKNIRKVHCIHTSTDRKRYILESYNGRGAVILKQISLDNFIGMSKALDEQVFDNIED